MGNTVSYETPAAAPAAAAGAPRKLLQLTERVQVNLDIDLNHIIAIAERAGQAIMEIYEGDAEGWNVDHKADDSPLTRADTEANKIICDSLAEYMPHVPIISEENKAAPYDIRKNYQYCWVVDPLDGTKEFIKRVPHFTVNIALLQGGTPVLGVVHTPAARTVHFGVKGRGAYVRNVQGDDKRIQCAEFDPSDPGLTLVGSASHMSPDTADFFSRFKDSTVKQIGSSLKFLLVAEGLAHVYPRLAPTMEWDTAAAHVIVTEAGGEVIQAGLCDNKGNALESWQEVLPKGEPVVYNKRNLLNPYFVVYGRRRATAAAAAAAGEGPSEGEAVPGNAGFAATAPAATASQ